MTTTSIDHSPGTDKLLTRKEAARYAGIAHVTMWRWMTKGVCDAFGNRIVLKKRRRGGRLYTTVAWIEEFFDALDASDEAFREHAEVVRPESPRERDARREREIQAAIDKVNSRVRKSRPDG